MAGVSGLLLAHIFAPSLIVKFAATPWLVPVMTLAFVINIPVAILFFIPGETAVKADLLAVGYHTG